MLYVRARLIVSVKVITLIILVILIVYKSTYIYYRENVIMLVIDSHNLTTSAYRLSSLSKDQIFSTSSTGKLRLY